MLCQRCRKRSAAVSVMININGRAVSANLCEKCAAESAFGANIPETDELWAMPSDAEQSIRARRKINELHAQLKAAVEKENYEEAARIRDALSRINENEVLHYE